MKRVMVAILALMVPCAALAQEPKPQQQKKAAEPQAEAEPTTGDDAEKAES